MRSNKPRAVVIIGLSGLVIVIIAAIFILVNRPTEQELQAEQITLPIQTHKPALNLILTGTADSIYPTPTIENEQFYIDPEGWYSIIIPAEWKENESPGSFSGENGFFETGYLPEMMFMQLPVNICQWMANIGSESTHIINAATSLSKIARSCLLKTLPEIEPATVQVIIHNPNADFEHRFFYIKMDVGH